MKKVFTLLSLILLANLANAQWRGNHHHNYPQRGYGNCTGPRVVFAPPRFGCNNGGRRSFINVVIAPRPRVVVAPNPFYNQPQVERIWVEGHYEESQSGRIWVEGHYIQREVY